MANKRIKINEEIAGTASEPLKYAAFADAGSYVTRGNGMLTMIFPELGPAQIAKWFRELGRTETFKKNENTFKGISSRFSSSPALKGLYVTLKKLKKKEVSDGEKESHESDLQLVINKIGKIIKSKLTEEDAQLFDAVSAELNAISETIAAKIDGSVVVQEPEEPKEEPSEEEPSEEEPSVDSVEEPSDEEETKSESLQRRVKNIVREILKKSVTKR